MSAQVNLLRPWQVDETKAELKRLENTINQPQAQDRPLMARQISNMRRRLEEGEPKPLSGKALDEAVAKADRLKAEMLDGMPTQAEMRKAPPGSTEKHLQWERRNKAKLREWKNLQLQINAGTQDADVANFERFRPAGGSGELSMDYAQIPGKQFHFGAALPTPGASATDAELAALGELAPDLRAQFAMLDGETRAQALQLVRDYIAGKTDPKLAKAKRAK